MTKCIRGRTENQIKNRFYSTLRRLAIKKAHGCKTKMNKEYLIQFVDEAIEHGHFCNSKRGRKPKESKVITNSQAFDCPAEIFEEEKYLNLSEDHVKFGREFIENQEEAIDINKDDTESMGYGRLSSEWLELQNEFDGFRGHSYTDLDCIHVINVQNEETLRMIEQKIQEHIIDYQGLLEIVNETKAKLKETQKMLGELCEKYIF